jgi:hypothetical protein
MFKNILYFPHLFGKDAGIIENIHDLFKAIE